jgi:PEP-CTERM motif
MRKTPLLTTGLAWLALTGAAGAATVTLTPGPLNPTYFNGQSVGSNTFSVGVDSWSLLSGTANIAVGTTPNVSAAPLGMTNPYMAVEGGGTEQVVFGTAQTSISIYWGSIDGNQGGNSNLNSFAITVDNYTLAGADLVAMSTIANPVTGTGDQLSLSGNQLVTITGLAAFTTATFTSTNNAFEFSLVPPGIGTRSGGTPEPSTWAMMILGFAGLGYAAFRRNAKIGALAI